MSLVLRLLVVFLCLIFFSGAARAELRIGITQAVFAKDALAFERWADYLSERMGEPVQFVYRKSYNEIQNLLKIGDLHFAWVCGYPYVKGTDAGYLRYVATPEIDGRPYYEIYLIVPESSLAKSLNDLKGMIFAFSDPDSVSFQALVRGRMAQDVGDLNQFFRIHFFTYGHTETIRAVADQVADGGSVDGHVWEGIRRSFPEIARKTRIIGRSRSYGLPPVVASWRASESRIASLQRVLVDMKNNGEGRQILDLLQISRFGLYDDALYRDIRLDMNGQDVMETKR